MKSSSLNLKRWYVIFRTLANVNRIKIIQMLQKGENMNVGEIAERLNISFKATSNHLAILRNLDILETRGVSGHVFYSFNLQLPKDFRKAAELFLG